MTIRTDQGGKSLQKWKGSDQWCKEDRGVACTQKPLFVYQLMKVMKAQDIVNGIVGHIVNGIVGHTMAL